MEKRTGNTEFDRPIPKIISGDNVEFIIPNTEDLRLALKHLDRVGATEVFYDGGKNLPAPFIELSLEINANDSDPYPSISTDLALDVDLFYDKFRRNWSDKLLDAIHRYFNENEISVFDVEYIANAKFVQLNDSHAVGIETIGDLIDGCSLKLNLVHMADIEEAAGVPLSIINHKHLDESPEVLYKYLCILANTIDVTIEALCDMAEYNHTSAYSLEANVPDYRADSLRAIGTAALAPPAEHHPSETKTRPIGFDQLGGLGYTVGELRKIAACFKDKENTSRYGIKPSHILLHGPPGTGKTTLAEALANEIGAQFKSIRSSDIMDKYIGESGKQLKQIFEEVFEMEENVVLFFDEFDTVGGQHENSSISHKEVKKLLQEYIIETSKTHPNILICAATNADIDDIEPAMIRSGRLVPLSVPRPNETERQEIWACVISKSITEFHQKHYITSDVTVESAFVPYLPDISTATLAKATDGMTGADFEEILARGRAFAYNKYIETGVDYQLSEKDLLKIIVDFSRR